MKCLVLGGDGMVGHKVFLELKTRCETYATLKGSAGNWSQYLAADDRDAAHFHGDLDVRHFDSVVAVMERIRPDIVINCIGMVKQRPEAQNVVPSIEINALFPHRLAALCEKGKARLIQLSTDCVFSGEHGCYAEAALPDPADLYGRTKLLGELDRPGCLTIRTSFVGWELKRRTGLLEWFASQRGATIQGYKRAKFSGVSTAVFARLVCDLAENMPVLRGIYHVAGSTISKHDLLVSLRDMLGWHDIIIEPEETFHCDRSLDGTRFEAATGWRSPGWQDMIRDLAAEWSTYERWRLKG